MTKEQAVNKIKIGWNKVWDFLVIKTKTHIFDILVLSIIIAISFLFFNHYDTSVTTIQGVKLIELTFNGRFFDFYSEINRPWFEGPGYDYSLIAYVPMNEQWRYCPAVYPIVTYILYGLLNLPFYLFGLLFNIQIDTIFYMTMNKLEAAIVLFVTYIFIKKIVGIFVDSKDNKNILLTFFGSAILIFAAFIFNQLDSFYVVFLVIGFYYVLKHKYWQGFLLMGFGCCFKYLPLMICFPILLLHHKKPWPIIKYTLILLAPSVFFYLMFFNNPGYKMTAGITDFNSQLFQAAISFGSSAVYLLFAFEIIGVVFAYIYKIKDDDPGYSSVYFAGYFAAVFTLFLQWNPQWMLMVVPFFALILILSKRQFLSFASIFLLELGYILFILTRFSISVGNSMIMNGLVSQLVNKQFYYSTNFLNFLKLTFGTYFDYGAISFTILAMGVIAFMITNFKQFIINPSLKVEHKGIPRYVNYLRMMVVVLFFVPYFKFYFNDPGAKISNETYVSQFEVAYKFDVVSSDNNLITITGFAFETSNAPLNLKNSIMLVDENTGIQYVLDTKQTLNGYYLNTKYSGTGFVVEMSKYKIPSGAYDVCILTTNNGRTSLKQTGVKFYDYY